MKSFLYDERAFGLPVFTDEQTTIEQNNMDQTSIPKGP